MTDTNLTKYTLRATEVSDLRSITEIYAHHVLHGLASFEETPPNIDEMTRRFHAIQDKNQPYYLVEREEDKKIVGYCYAGSFRERNAYRFTLESTLYLRPGFEGLGLGGRMLDILISEGEKRGFRQMVAVIGDSQNTGSIGVHQTRGFKMTGTLEGTGFKHGQWIDTVLMQLALKDGNKTLPAI